MLLCPAALQATPGRQTPVSPKAATRQRSSPCSQPQQQQPAAVPTGMQLQLQPRLEAREALVGVQLAQQRVCRAGPSAMGSWLMTATSIEGCTGVNHGHQGQSGGECDATERCLVCECVCAACACPLHVCIVERLLLAGCGGVFRLVSNSKKLSTCVSLQLLTMLRCFAMS